MSEQMMRPRNWTVWKHNKSGKDYIVVFTANWNSDKPKYPPHVVYTDWSMENVYSGRADDWYNRMTYQGMFGKFNSIEFSEKLRQTQASKIWEEHVAADVSGFNETTPSITCPKCGRTSYNAGDIEMGYCGACRDWTTPKDQI